MIPLESVRTTPLHTGQSPSASDATTPSTTALDKHQQCVVDHPAGYLAVSAGPGSGKTRTLIACVLRLLAAGVAPEAILVVTFTNAAAGEIRARLREQHGAAAAGVRVTTLHALGYALLREHHAVLGLPRTLTVLRPAAQQRILDHLLAALPPAQRAGVKARDLRTAISRTKRTTPTATGALAPHGTTRARTPSTRTPSTTAKGSRSPASTTRTTARTTDPIATIASAYAARLAACGAVDLDDLIVRAAELLRDHPAVRCAVGARYRAVLVDEFQDLDAAQVELVRHLASVHGNLTVVGDDDQSLYAWRGAVPAALATFAKATNTAVLHLPTNHRSTRRIIAAAAAVIARATDRAPKRIVAKPGAPRGTRVRVREIGDTTHEAEVIAAQLRHHHAEHSLPWSEMAVLVRERDQLEPIATALTTAGIPHVVRDPKPRVDNAREHALAVLTAAARKHPDDGTLLTLLAHARGVGPATRRKLLAAAQRTRVPLHAVLAGDFASVPAKARTPLRALLASVTAWRQLARPAATKARTPAATTNTLPTIATAILRRARVPTATRRAVVADLTALPTTTPSTSIATSLSAALDALTLRSLSTESITAAPAPTSASGAVTLSTAHGAKGCEWDAVVVAGVEAGLYPHRSAATQAGTDEGRRVLYVAMTRARRHLTLTHAMERPAPHGGRTEGPSPFLNDIPWDLTADAPLPGER